MSTKQTDILISGAGIPGLTLAILLGEFGLNITLLEPFPPKPPEDIEPNGRTVALLENSINIIKATGIWDQIDPHSNPLEIMRIIDDSMHKEEALEAPFEAIDIGLEQFGFNIPNNILRAVLFETAQATKNITIHQQKLARIEQSQTHAQAHLENGQTVQAQLIVGADGRHSAVRDQAGIKAKKKEYGQSAITCLINHSKSHQNISTEFHKPGGPLAFVPLPGNQSSVVWVEKTQKAEALLKLKKQDFTQALQDQSRDILGGITLETGPQSWPLIALQTNKLIAPRIALIAESAHVMSPVTAQGLNLSLRDVATLAEIIADHARLGLDIGSKTVLSKYEKRRKLDVKTRIAGVDGMNILVAQDKEILKRIRRSGLKTVQQVPPLKRLAMQYGLAPQLDQSRLATGTPL